MPLRFEDLTVYQKGLDIVDKIYIITKDFPKEETFLLISQLRRAATSIVLNIAEGSGRTKKEFNHFLNTSRTSCYECIAGLQIAMRQGYTDKENYKTIEKSITEIIRMLNGLKNSLNKH